MMVDTWNDMLTILNDPMVSFDHLDSPSTIAGSAATMNSGMKNFAYHLETIHKSIQENIHNAPSGDQCTMLSV